MPRARLNDVARHAGVSKSTASRALNGVGISNYLFPNEQAVRNLAHSYDFDCDVLNGPHNRYMRENPTRWFFRLDKRRPATAAH